MDTLLNLLSQVDLEEFSGYAARFFLAAFLGVLLSFQRSPDSYRLNLIEAHALLAIAGAMFITIIGDNFIRAVGLLGAASVVRYRYAIQNPRDASTLILALGIGMACGSDLLLVATMGTFLIMFISQMIAHFPDILPIATVARREERVLRLQASDYDRLMERVEQIFKERGIEFSLISYERKYRKMGTEPTTEVNLQLIMSSEFTLHELTHLLLDDNIYRVSWHTP